MVKTTLFIFFVVFAVLGLCEVIYFFKMLFYYPGMRCNNCIIIVLKDKYALRQLNFLWQKLKWLGNGYASVIIAITDYLELEEISSCADFTYDKNIVLCDLNSLAQCKCLQGDYLNGNR